MALWGFIFITTIIVTMMIVLFSNGTCNQYERLGKCPWIETSTVTVFFPNIRENTILANFRRCNQFFSFQKSRSVSVLTAVKRKTV